MRFRCLAGLALPLTGSMILCAVAIGCKKESASTAATGNNGTPPAAPAAEPPPPPPPPPYKLPDKLPVRATLKFLKQEDGAASYQATFDQKFSFDPAQAQLALDINTVGWTHLGRIVVSNKDDNAVAPAHLQYYDAKPTTEGLDVPEEHILIGTDENQWIKDGTITILIRNEDSGDDAPVPKILTVDLVER